MTIQFIAKYLSLGFFNPQSFLTAIMQSTARKNELPLDRMCLVCDITKKQKEEVTMAPRDGAYINGLFMEVGLLPVISLSLVGIPVQLSRELVGTSTPGPLPSRV